MRTLLPPLATALCCLGAFAFCQTAVAAESADQPTAEQLEFFESKVRPILVERCYECHSGDQKEPKGGLKVDSRAALLAGGETGPAVVPGNLKESLLIDAINYGDLYQMPPKSKMPEAEIAVLTRWVEQGAPWPKETSSAPAAGSTAKGFDIQQRKAEHWCWQTVQNPPPPQVKNAGWAKQDLDRFILARLEKEGLSPALPADKRTLVRRAYFDLIGLPPSPAEMQGALADTSPDWFAKLIDQLLDSPHFGERWGRHWLDLVRYAESRGHEFDYNAPNAWQYRDYVIRALNADVPYDQFVTEHIAGDLLKSPRVHPTDKFNESIIGTGFWFLGEWVHSPVDIRKDETDRFDNMVDVFGKTFLGVTISCARCHDHKFDAISQKDYYALFGFLQSSGYRLARIDTMLEEQQIAARAAKLQAEGLGPIAAAEARSRQAVVARTADYLLAARELIQAGVTVKPDLQDDVSLGSLDEATRAKIAAVAEAKKLEASLLTRWLAELNLALPRKPHPLHAWAKLCALPGDQITDPQKLREILASEYPSATVEQTSEDAGLQVIVDYDQSPAEHWMPDGVGLGTGPVRTGQLQLDPTAEKPSLTLADSGSACRDPLWKGLKLAPGTDPELGKFKQTLRPGLTLRTPTFELKTGKVHVQVDGHGFIYAAVDSHVMIEGPLHGHLLRDTGPATLAAVRWITLNLDAYKGHRLHLEFTPHGDSDFRVLKVVEGEKPPAEPPFALPSLATSAADSLTLEAIAAAYQANLTTVLERLAADKVMASNDSASQSALARWVLQRGSLFAGSDEASVAAREEAARLVAEYCAQWRKLKESIRPESRLAMAMWDGSPENETLLIRGNPKTVGPIVPRGMLTAIDTGPMNLGSGSGRLELARSLVDERNPLTARVMANRVWHHLFGRGIVASTDNFGVLGQEPTHPELLDHLATRFREDGWSVKRLIRTIMLSSTYQQDSRASSQEPEDRSQVAVVADAEAADPQNLLFHRQNLKRLEGEVIRDSLLAVSGRLDPTRFGPSVAVHLTPFMQGRGRPASGPLDGNGRRSIYLAIRRNFLNPMMLAFNTPNPATTVGKRNVSNVPAQALILMNDPLVIEQARVWAKTILASDASSAEVRIERMYQQAFARSPSSEEAAAAIAFMGQQAAEYGLSADQAKTDERVWTDLGHVLFNVKEFVFVR